MAHDAFLSGKEDYGEDGAYMCLNRDGKKVST